MILEIIKIIPFKKSCNEGEVYLRITFLDRLNNSWYKTDIVPGFRNYQRWKKIARVGNKLFNLQLKDAMTIDADSYPILLEGRRMLKSTIEDDEYLKKLCEEGVFN